GRAELQPGDPHRRSRLHHRARPDRVRGPEHPGADRARAGQEVLPRCVGNREGTARDDDLRDCGDAARPNRSWAAPDALRAGLRNLGYVDGGTLVIEPRYAGGQVERLSTLAAELVRLKVDLLVTAAAGSARAARKATSTAPQLKTADDAASALG